MDNRTLNIKNPETYRLASEVAAKTGESMTRAVTTALRERLDRIEAEKAPKKKLTVEEIMAIGREFSALLGDEKLNIDDLYDEETGLPK